MTKEQQLATSKFLLHDTDGIPCLFFSDSPRLAQALISAIGVTAWVI